MDAAIKLPAAVPNVVIAVGFILAFGGAPFNLHGTVLILLLAYLVVHFPQGSVAADAAVSSVGQDLLDAAEVSGSHPGRTFLRIQFPMMLAGLAAGWALVFVRTAGDLTASALLAGIRNPVVGFRILEIYENGAYADLAALAIVLTIVSTVVVGIAFTWFGRGMSFLRVDG